MITIQVSGQTFVGTSEGEILLNAPGSYQFPQATYIAAGTNYPVNISATLRDGAVILVDPSGYLRISDGPDLVTAVVSGFSLSIMALGVFMSIRWVWRKVMGAVQVGSAFD
jgi:hypothetical protein